jgi:hypothetical protein
MSAPIRLASYSTLHLFSLSWLDLVNQDSLSTDP